MLMKHGMALFLIGGGVVFFLLLSSGCSASRAVMTIPAPVVEPPPIDTRMTCNGENGSDGLWGECYFEEEEAEGQDGFFRKNDGWIEE